MNALMTAVRELWGLFVEDGSFTIGLVIAVAIGIWVLPRIGMYPQWRGPLFFVIVAIVLFENVARSART